MHLAVLTTFYLLHPIEDAASMSSNCGDVGSWSRILDIPCREGPAHWSKFPCASITTHPNNSARLVMFGIEPLLVWRYSII